MRTRRKAGLPSRRLAQFRWNRSLFQPDNPSPTRESVEPAFTGTHILPVPWMEPIDVSRAILYLVGESGRYITASTLTIDAGFIVKS